MRRHTFLALGSAVLAALLGCSTTGKSIDYDLELTLPSELISSLRGHTPPLPAGEDLLSFARTTDVEHLGNFGKITTETEQITSRWNSDGQSLIASLNVYTGPNGSKTYSSSTSVSICGLIPLLTEQSASGASQITTTVPAAGTPQPISFDVKNLTSAHYRIRTFEANTPNVCTPKPGMAFSYKLTAEVQRKYSSNSYNSNKLHELSEEVTCNVAPESKPSTSLHPSLRGSHLEVTCLHLEADKPARSVRLVFLQESGLYVPIRLQLNEYQTTTSNYSDAKYR